MDYGRRSGILLHPTSLSDTNGIGTLGSAAYAFVDWLMLAQQSLWQILPLGPTGYGDSPYASFSTYAGNPLLVDLDMLSMNKRADSTSLIPPEHIKCTGNIDYGSVIKWKMGALKNAARWFLEHGQESDKTSYEKFKKTNSVWLNDFASFITIKEFYDDKAAKQNTSGIWYTFWPHKLGIHDAKAVSDWNEEHRIETEVVKVIQYFFFDQWQCLKSYAARHGVSIIGDIPIFVSSDSADVWAHHELFQVDAHGRPCFVSGVPPDYFSTTGQLWGNPLYDWDAMKNDGYRWWIERIRHTLSLVDYVRIDHFRGFEACWAVPYGNDTAIEGKWQKGPGAQLFDSVRSALGDVPVIAEDLGIITQEVRDLRDACGFPGMKILQFAFDASEAKMEGMTNAFLPHTYPHNCVVYTGTHDNQTTQGWLESLPTDRIRMVASYANGENISDKDAVAMVKSGALCKKMVTMALSSVANFAIIPFQDLICAGDEARMNTPSTTGMNWAWRFDDGSLTEVLAKRLAYTSALYGRNIRIKKNAL